MTSTTKDNENLSLVLGGDVDQIKKCAPKSEAKMTIRLTIPNLSSLCEEVETDYQYLANFPWQLLAQTECTEKTSNVKFFSAYVYCNPDSESTIWSCDAIIVFRLISQNSKGAADFTRQITKKFNYNSICCGIRSFIEWSEIINPDLGFVREDKVILEAEIIVQKVVGTRQNLNFDFSSNALVSDGVLVIGGVRLFISKPYLALHSPVFRAMFFSEFMEREMKEISVEDVILEEFVELLNVIYPSHAPITSDNIEYLLELGDKFQIHYVINECEKFLTRVNDNTISRITKLVYAEQYCLAKLQDVCIRKFKDVREIKGLKNMDEYKKLSDSTKAALLEKMLKLV